MKISESPSFQSLTSALSKGKQAVSLFIYDNSPEAQQPVANPCWDAIYTHHTTNAGVSKAYNEGFTKAKKLNKKWLLLADQDTIFPPTIFDDYFNVHLKNPGLEILAPILKSESRIISPFRFALGRGFSVTEIKSETKSIDDLKFINSGLLITVNLFEKSGGFDERFPLDFSDLVFTQRLKGNCKDFAVVNTICLHRLSSDDESLSAQLVRFNFFLKGSRLYGELYGSRFFLLVNRFVRAVKLSVRFRSGAFLKLFMSRDFEQH